MPILANPRHELFCQNLAHGMAPTQAYVAAGYHADASHAARLGSAGHIVARVHELQERRASEFIQAIPMTIPQGIEELEEARKGAMTAGKYGDAISAVVSKLKAAGLWTERSERTSVKVEASEMTDEELVERIRQADADTAKQLQ